MRNRFTAIALACAFLGGLSLAAPNASAQRRDRTVIVHTNTYGHRHKIVRYVRVRRNGHWVTVRRVTWR